MATSSPVVFAPLDLAVINFDGGVGNVGILRGNGDGTFQSPVEYATGNGPNQVAVGDFNNDQKPDLVVANGIGKPSASS